MSDLVKLYNPANASALSEEDILGLRNLTSPQIKELANAYPNLTMQRAYLLIVDGSKAVDKQIPNLSTFENLWNLREKNGQKRYVAYNFRGNYKPKHVTATRINRREVIDLSDEELRTLPGFKTPTENFPPQDVKVTTVKKELVADEGKVVEMQVAEPRVKRAYNKKPK